MANFEDGNKLDSKVLGHSHRRLPRRWDLRDYACRSRHPTGLLSHGQRKEEMFRINEMKQKVMPERGAV